ncbi:ubiquitin-protein ligase E3 C [Fistulifera solaris]|uniref:HECT-type E3 ubiquitin transferase n=1 Tax=Fistulifera solaris TaxID=1519565 RepID=A0A1Z5KRF7_FISSO|nr:ubiquitin-protein ligase E3 C [Fistulifera solaris]|eukprot:GAX28859.1 ubiquitin-protein ligase E3 C [Fistulifera solaris]
MFDGQFRTRRNVNLGGKTSRRSRKEILEDSKRQRQDREKAQRQEKCAIFLQKMRRGAQTRKKLIEQLEDSLTQATGIDTYTRNLDVLLRLYSGSNMPHTKVEIWLSNISLMLQEYGTQLREGILAKWVIKATFLWMQQAPSAFTERDAICGVILEHILSQKDYVRQNLGYDSGYSLAVDTMLTTTDSRLAQLICDAIFRATPCPAGEAVLGALALLQSSEVDWQKLEALYETLSQSRAIGSRYTYLRDTVDKIASQHGLAMLRSVLSLSSTNAFQTGVVVGITNKLMARSTAVPFFCSLLVRDEDPVKVLSSSTELSVATPINTDDNDSSSDEEDGWSLRRKSNSILSDRVSSVARVTMRHEIKTAAQLDRVMSVEYQSWRNQSLEILRNTNNEQAIAVAREIVDARRWIKWSADLVGPTDSIEIVGTKDMFALLGQLLKPLTGLTVRQSSRSTFLSQLAFEPKMSEHLWSYTQRFGEQTQDPSFLTAMSAFCDLLSHRLIAMLDSQFLEQYNSEGSQIRAGDVILRIKLILFSLYWEKPVKTGDLSGIFGIGYSLDALRARLFLTGTKVWNSLHDRWCRLLRHAEICDESSWLFPDITSFGDNNAVVRGHTPSNGDQMDTDESEDEQMAGDDLDQLADVFSDPKMGRVLTSIPQALPFDRRVRLFQSLLNNDKQTTQNDEAAARSALVNMLRGEDVDMMSGRERVSIRRDRLYSDSMKTLNKLGSRLRRRIQVSFVNQHGAAEAGIDGGGVFKEFIDDLIKDAFLRPQGSTATHQLFSVTPQQTLAVNTSLAVDQTILDQYEFLGRVLGKAVYESILVDPQFCLPFLNQLLGKRNSLEDLKNYDLEYYRNLIKLLTLSAAEVESLCLTFEMTIGDEQTGKVRMVDLITGGRDVPVTKQSVIQYVHLVANHRLNVISAAQTKAFLSGFRDLIPAPWVRLFSSYELQKLISGDDRGIDVLSFKEAMQYASGYHPSQEVVKWFWEIVCEMSAEQQQKLLKFMTSCSRQPLLGFSSLEPSPCLQQIRLPNSLRETMDLEVLAKATPLPTASTCMNLLKLPNYPNKQLMKWKLLAAIEAGAGFELT